MLDSPSTHITYINSINRLITLTALLPFLAVGVISNLAMTRIEKYRGRQCEYEAAPGS